MTALVETQQKATLSAEQVAERRAAMDADVWLFIKWVCGHGADDIERFHRPMAYFLAGDAPRLAACLNVYDSDVTRQLKAELTRRGIDWNTKPGLARLARLLKRVNNRVSRSMGKTTIGLDVLLWKASVDPDISILIASKSDDAAWAMCESIGNLMRSDAYKAYYGDRLFPSDPEGYITKKWIRMHGRTLPHQDTIEARGVTSQSYSKHYHEIYNDDLASTEAKQGEATVQDAVRFMASIEGISISERWGGTRVGFNGTIQGPKDDHSKLVNNPDFISVVVPIWRHPSGAPWTVKNMMDDGVPTLPELYDVPAIRAKRAYTIAHDQLGKISWLQNFLLCAHEAGSMQFTADLLRRSFFHWIPVRAADGTVRREIRRYLYSTDDKGNELPRRSTSRKPQACLCYMNCGLTDHDYVQFDPLRTPRHLGVDQAIAGTGDQWGVGVVTVDDFGHKYQLKGRYGQGYWKMIPAIGLVFKDYGGMFNPPAVVGMESNAWQQITADWMKRDDEFRYLSRRVQKLSPSNIAKVARIWNDIYSALEDGTLHLDPDDQTFQDCALKYNGADPDSQWDDPLDCVAMAIQTHTRKSSTNDAQDIRAQIASEDADYARYADTATGIDLSDDWWEAI